MESRLALPVADQGKNNSDFCKLCTACVSGQWPAAPATLPMHTIPLNNPSCLHTTSHPGPPTLAQRNQCPLRTTTSRCTAQQLQTKQPASRVSLTASGAARTCSSTAKRALHLRQRCSRSWPAAAGKACGWFERSKLSTSKSCPWGGWREAGVTQAGLRRGDGGLI